MEGAGTSDGGDEADFTSWRVRDLKGFLAERGVSGYGVLERSELETLCEQASRGVLEGRDVGSRARSQARPSSPHDDGSSSGASRGASDSEGGADGGNLAAEADMVEMDAFAALGDVSDAALLHLLKSLEDAGSRDLLEDAAAHIRLHDPHLRGVTRTVLYKELKKRRHGSCVLAEKDEASSDEAVEPWEERSSFHLNMLESLKRRPTERLVTMLHIAVFEENESRPYEAVSRKLGGGLSEDDMLELCSECGLPELPESGATVASLDQAGWWDSEVVRCAYLSKPELFPNKVLSTSCDNWHNDCVLVAMYLSARFKYPTTFTPAEICAEFASRGLPVPVDAIDAVVDADGPFVISSLDDLIMFYKRDGLLQFCSDNMTHFGDCSMAVARLLTIMLLDAFNVHYLIPPEAVEVFLAAQGDGSPDVPAPPAFAGMGDLKIDSIAQLVRYELVTAKVLKPVLSALYLRHAGDFGVMAEQLARSLLRRIKPGITIDLPAALIEAQCGAWDIIPAEAPDEEDGDVAYRPAVAAAAVESLAELADAGDSLVETPASASNDGAPCAAEVESVSHKSATDQEETISNDGTAAADETSSEADGSNGPSSDASDFEAFAEDQVEAVQEAVEGLVDAGASSEDAGAAVAAETPAESLEADESSLEGMLDADASEGSLDSAAAAETAAAFAAADSRKETRRKLALRMQKMRARIKDMDLSPAGLERRHVAFENRSDREYLSLIFCTELNLFFKVDGECPSGTRVTWVSQSKEEALIFNAAEDLPSGYNGFTKPRGGRFDASSREMKILGVSNGRDYELTFEVEFDVHDRSDLSAFPVGLNRSSVRLSICGAAHDARQIERRERRIDADRDRIDADRDRAQLAAQAVAAVQRRMRLRHRQVMRA